MANGVGWSAPRVGRKDNHAKSASARVLRGRSAGSRGKARADHTPRDSEAMPITTVRSRSNRPGAVSLKKSLVQRCGVECAPRWPRRQPRQVRQRARAPWAVGCFSTGRNACAPLSPRDSKAVATAFRSRSRRSVAVSVKKTLGVGRKDNNAKSASARVLRGRSAVSPQARARRSPWDSKAVVTAFRSRRPGAVSLKKSLGQRRGVRCWFERRARGAGHEHQMN